MRPFMTAKIFVAVFGCSTALQLLADNIESTPVTEAEYQQVATLKDDDAMGQLIHRLVASKGQRITSLAELSGFAPWYSGTRVVQSLSTLQEDLATRWWVVSGDLDAEYQRIASLNDDAAMTEFIKRLVAIKGHRITSLSELSGLAPWYSGTRSVQSLSALQEDLATKWWVVPAFAVEPWPSAPREPHGLFQNEPTSLAQDQQKLYVEGDTKPAVQEEPKTDVQEKPKPDDHDEPKPDAQEEPKRDMAEDPRLDAQKELAPPVESEHKPHEPESLLLSSTRNRRFGEELQGNFDPASAMLGNPDDMLRWLEDDTKARLDRDGASRKLEDEKETKLGSNGAMVGDADDLSRRFDDEDRAQPEAILATVPVPHVEGLPSWSAAKMIQVGVTASAKEDSSRRLEHQVPDTYLAFNKVHPEENLFHHH